MVYLCDCNCKSRFYNLPLHTLFVKVRILLAAPAANMQGLEYFVVSTVHDLAGMPWLKPQRRRLPSGRSSIALAPSFLRCAGVHTPAPGLCSYVDNSI